jgi:hypothetical protein
MLPLVGARPLTPAGFRSPKIGKKQPDRRPCLTLRGRHRSGRRTSGPGLRSLMGKSEHTRLRRPYSPEGSGFGPSPQVSLTREHPTLREGKSVSWSPRCAAVAPEPGPKDVLLAQVPMCAGSHRTETRRAAARRAPRACGDRGRVRSCSWPAPSPKAAGHDRLQLRDPLGAVQNRNSVRAAEAEVCGASASTSARQDGFSFSKIVARPAFSMPCSCGAASVMLQGAVAVLSRGSGWSIARPPPPLPLGVHLQAFPPEPLERGCDAALVRSADASRLD